ncbi:SNF2 family helicase/ATPase (Swr1), putative [Paecilomyces variotii No. 5]|uniref:Helicase SWR1 n=1 Tax=Byssochlamys spectabilis (strain No. 5 / NBRC 109023) TaxID=1356009 RepID=V5FNN9_BYSSN|nr:SNF2 family helicase/ATPase (Swr1), putative [Paecilomyces variotii No. 5]
MQNGNLNGSAQPHERVTPEPESKTRTSPVPQTPTDSASNDLGTPGPNEDTVANQNSEGPPSKKRKLTDSTSRRSRPPSPPWKKIGVEGPTSFLENGRRRSSRTNAIPLELQPQSDKRNTRATRKEYVTKALTGRAQGAPSPLASSAVKTETNGRKSLGGRSSANGTLVGSLRKSGAKPAAGKDQVSQSPAARPGGTRTRSRSSAYGEANGVGPDTDGGKGSLSAVTSPAAATDKNTYRRTVREEYNEDEAENTQKLPRLRFKVKKPSLAVQHPSHVLAPRKYASFRAWIESGDGIKGDSDIVSPDQAREEAEKRLRILEAGESGGVLSPEICSAYLTEQQEEPPQQYSHQDHLVAHALYFRKLLEQEHRRHRNMARLFAQWCADAWRKRNKDPEDILREQEEEVRLRRKQLAKDLQKQFDLVRAEVDKMRLARWEQERKAEDQQALDRAIKQSTLLFEKRRLEILGGPETETDADADADDSDEDEQESEEDESEGGSEEGDGSEPEEERESIMSSTDSESDEDGADDDANLTTEQLRLKYANLQSNDLAERMSITSDQTESSVHSETLQADHVPDDTGSAMDTQGTPDHVPLDEVNPLLLDDSDESTDMSDDMGDSDEEMDSDEDDNGEDSEEDGDEDNAPGLLGFFSNKEAAALRDNDEDGGISASDAEEPEEQDEVSLIPTGVPNEKVNGDEASASAPSPGNVVDAQHGSRQSGDVSSQASPGTFVTKPSESESVSSYEPALEKPATQEKRPTSAVQPGSPADSTALATLPPSDAVVARAGTPHTVASTATPGLKTAIPHLLRGTLREYQHFGLDWLAGLYNNHINGILADEMGLGKTIQTIALLAHLAVEHEVWGPHLVVVPTSVILNWEMEFKKWCPGFKIMTYYGNQEERKAKRRGWTDDTSWDVLITSYQLVLQDQQVLKRRNWHYMILDEAHNIKNFRSQRWQALLTFKTRARLLLTGTPLQNNLTELWSLLFFLMPSDGDEAGTEGFADLRNFSEWFRRPVEQILEHGRETMDEEAKRVVTKLHTVLRPYILRRLKADVEKQMPAKYEHVVYCRLSKRQRYLYDGFMSRAQTKETLASGNYLSIINCLMQLRKVCNHPDLFETRPISTSFAMPKSIATEFEIKELLVRRRLLYEDPLTKLDLDFLNLAPISREGISRRIADDTRRISAYASFKALRERQCNRANWAMGFDGSSIGSMLISMENASRKKRVGELERCMYFESKRHGLTPVYGQSLIEFLTSDNAQKPWSSHPSRGRSMADWLSSRSSVLASMILSIEDRAHEMEGYVKRFACVTPAAIASGVTEAALTPIQSRSLSREQRFPPYDPFHEAQMRMSIAFPDKRLLQYDCGKLQRLDKLLRDLQAGGHRALIFTQMTKMLDILEQFLNIHGHRYLRLDGTTKVEQRQMLTERFNSDNRILAFILSTRSGGLGINLTGADTVIFYDLDWNPAMDKQCQDRCHRIGQTRDVHIYRFVSEYTIESNILRKANQKRMLDDVVIQEGEFTTDYFTKIDPREMIGDDMLAGNDEASAAMDRVLNTRVGGTVRAFEQAEDKEDIDAAKNAQKELEHADDGDFEERSVSHSTPAQAGTPMATGTTEDETPGAQTISSPQVHVVDEDAEVEQQPSHIDDYLLRFMEWNLKDEPLVLPPDKTQKKYKRGKEHRVKKKRL